MTVTGLLLRAVAHPKMSPFLLTCIYVKPSGIMNTGGASPFLLRDSLLSAVLTLSFEVSLVPPPGVK